MTTYHLALRAACLAAGLLAASCAASREPDKLMGNTNWLATCERDADCTGGLACICDLCTRECSDESACAELAGATCDSSSSDFAAACGEGSDTAICLARSVTPAMDAAISDSAIADGAIPDSAIPDAETLDGELPNDAATGENDASIADTCGLDTCPEPISNNFDRCCAGNSCGIFYSFRGPSGTCMPIESGSSDEDCLAARLDDGSVAEGCCRADNTCGHYDEQFGCHRLVNYFWHEDLTSCDGPPSEVPDEPFACLGDTPCTADWQCCLHDNYATQCSVVSGSEPPDPDAGPKFCNHCPDC